MVLSINTWISGYAVEIDVREHGVVLAKRNGKNSVIESERRIYGGVHREVHRLPIFPRSEAILSQYIANLVDYKHGIFTIHGTYIYPHRTCDGFGIEPYAPWLRCYLVSIYPDRAFACLEVECGGVCVLVVEEQCAVP